MEREGWTEGMERAERRYLTRHRLALSAGGSGPRLLAGSGVSVRAVVLHDEERLLPLPLPSVEFFWGLGIDSGESSRGGMESRRGGRRGGG